MQRQNIGIADVPFVWPGVNGYTLCPKTLTVLGRVHHVRIVTTPRISQRGYLIDIYTQSCHDLFVRINLHCNLNGTTETTLP